MIDTLKDLNVDVATANATALELELLAREESSQDVLSYLEALSRTNSENDAFRLAIIRTHLQNGELEQALEKADELAATQPDNPSYSYFNGITKLSAGRYPSAQAIFEQLVDANPNFVQAWLQLSRVMSVTDPDGQLDVVNRGLEATQEAPDLLWAKASILQNQDDIDGAIEIYEGLYEENSNSMVIANNLASLLATFRSDEEGLKRAQTIARRLRGTEVAAFQDTYGWIQFRNGNTEEALEYLEPAAASLTNDASVQYHVGSALFAAGRTQEALDALTRAVEVLGPGTSALEDEIRAKQAEVEAAQKQEP